MCLPLADGSHKLSATDLSQRCAALLLLAAWLCTKTCSSLRGRVRLQSPTTLTYTAPRLQVCLDYAFGDWLMSSFINRHLASIFLVANGERASPAVRFLTDDPRLFNDLKHNVLDAIPVPMHVDGHWTARGLSRLKATISHANKCTPCLVPLHCSVCAWQCHCPCGTAWLS